MNALHSISMPILIIGSWFLGLNDSLNKTYTFSTLRDTEYKLEKIGVITLGLVTN